MDINLKLVAFTFCPIFLAGCATAKRVMAPSGKMGFSIECNGTAVSMTSCYEKAAEVCPNGYSIIAQNNSSGIVANPNFIVGTSDKGIFIECKE